jgi:nucleotide-binding universal stress UspA family protein
MGRDGLMSDRLNVTHSRFSTPHRAIMATGAVTGLLILVGLRIQEIVALLAQVASFSFLVTYGLVHIAVVVFRRADPEEYDPAFEMPRLLYPVVPALGVVMTGIVISQMEPPVIVVGTGVVALGIVWYVTYARDRGVEEGLFDEAFGSLIQNITTRLPGSRPTALSGEPYRVVVGVANPETQRGLLRLAAATARARGEDETGKLIAVNVIEAESGPDRNVASDRLESQRALLGATRELATEMDIALRTSAVVAEDAGETLVDVIREENADQALVGWQGQPEQEKRVFGSTLDTVIAQAPCNVSLVKIEDDTIGTPVALAGSGPHAPVAARRAADFATVSNSTAVLLNVQQRTADEQPNQVKQGQETIRSVADRGGLETEEYESAVVVATDVESAIAQAVQEYDTVCVGLSEREDLSRAMFGSLAERISREVAGNVAIVRSGEAVNHPATEPEKLLQ